MESLNPIILRSSSGEPYYYTTTAESDNTNAAGTSAAAGDPFDFPCGYRFCPFDEELIDDYLKKKVMNEELPPNRIPEVNFYQYTPEELSHLHRPIEENQWYFFTPRDRKYPNGDRPNRAAGSGYWKATGSDKPIKDKDLIIIGLRKALVFYEGKPPQGDKTNWIMHEFRINGPSRQKSNAYDMRLDDWVLCRMYKKVDKSFKCTTRSEDFHSTQDQQTTTLQPQVHPQQHNNGSTSALTTTMTMIHNGEPCNLPYFHSEMLSAPNNPYLIPQHQTNQPFMNDNHVLTTTTTPSPVTSYQDDNIYSQMDWINHCFFNSDARPNKDDIFIQRK